MALLATDATSALVQIDNRCWCMERAMSSRRSERRRLRRALQDGNRVAEECLARENWDGVRPATRNTSL